MQLENKVAIVTGADSGIGRAIAYMMAQRGAKLVVDYIGDPTKAQQLVDDIEAFGGRASAVEADITKPESVERLVQQSLKRFGDLDILVNNAGIEKKMPFLDTPFDVWNEVIAVDLTGPWLCSQVAARAMVGRKHGGRIVNISSVHEDLTMPTNAPYCAAKGGMRMMMRTIAVELAPHGITVNDVCPGAVDTPMDATLKRDQAKYDDLLREIPLRRMAQPEEIAALVCFLASAEAAYITGASYVIDGGLSKKSGSL